MTQPGAPAALQGYRLQALYTLKRVFAEGLGGTHRFQPEGIEDLDILDPDGTLVEAIQVKSYPNLTLSDLEPEKTNSFFHRAADLLRGKHPPTIQLVNFGAIGPELFQAWQGNKVHRDRVTGKLVDKGFEQDEIEELFEFIKLVPVNEEAVLEETLAPIRELSTGINPENALDLFVAWYYQIAEQRRIVGCAELIGKVNSMSRFLAERYHYHQQWYTTIQPLEAVPMEAERIPQLRDEFYAGVGTRYEHILADLDFPREHKIAEMSRAFRESKVVILHAASGQGKSTLACRYLHDFYPNKWRFAIRRVQDTQQALSIAQALSGFARAVEVPIAVHLDVNPRDGEWPELVRQLGQEPYLEILVTVREEDYRRANISGADLSFANLNLDFDQAEARLIYDRAFSRASQWDFLDFDAAWDAFGGQGPLMEFVYLLTQTETLQQRLSGQIQRIEDEVRGHQSSADGLRLLSLVSLASAYGARLRTRDVIELLRLPAPNATLERFEQEYLLRRTVDGLYLEGLHPIRSQILSGLLIHIDANPWLEIVAQAFPVVLEEDLETFILHALVDEDHRADTERFLDLVTSLQPQTWSGMAGILRSLLWTGAREYVEANQAMLDRANEELGPGWWFAVDLDFTLPGEGPGLGDWWTTMGSLIPPDRQARIKAIRESQTPKDTVFQRSHEWLRSLATTPEPPSTPRDWQHVAEVWYWAARLTPDQLRQDWVQKDNLEASVVDLPLETLADLSFSFHQIDSERHQTWLISHEDTLHRRLAGELAILALETVDTTLKIHFIPSGDVEGDSSDLLHNETVANISLIRRLFPGYGRYGSQGYGFKPAGIELPQGDSTRKEGIPATHLIPRWPVWLSGVVSSIARLRHRPDSWAAYLDMRVGIRRSIVNCLDDMNEGLVKFYRRDKPINILSEHIDLEAWENCRLQLSGEMDLPKPAVDPWGFASETADGSHVQALARQQQIPTAIALQKYKPYLQAQREYFAAFRNFFDQALAVWTTNAQVGKLYPNDPAREVILGKLRELDVETSPHLPVLNLFDARTHLSEYQQHFRTLFAQHLGEDGIAALEKRESEALEMSWALWYYYAYEPWKGAANPRQQVWQWMKAVRRQIVARIQQALETMQTPQQSATLLEYDRNWRALPTLWVVLDVDDPIQLYATVLETLVSALRNAMGNPDNEDLDQYLIQEVCQYVVIIPRVQGRMLDDFVWPLYLLSILQADDIKDRPWAYIPAELPEAVHDDLDLTCWNLPEIHAANRLSRSVMTLRQLTSQISEFQGVPDLTEPGMHRLQTYINEEVSPTLSTSLQTFYDATTNLTGRFNSLPEEQQQNEGNLLAAIRTLVEVQEYVRPGEDDGTCQLDLTDIVDYRQRLEKAYLEVEAVRLLWISDILEQSAT